MQAITVKFHPATNTKPARVQASASAGKGKMWSYDHAAGSGRVEDAAQFAARAYCEQYGWKGRWYAGTLAGGDTVYVCADPHHAMNFNA